MPPHSYAKILAELTMFRVDWRFIRRLLVKKQPGSFKFSWSITRHLTRVCCDLQRTVVPAVMYDCVTSAYRTHSNLNLSIILTGWAMSEHAQALMISTRVRPFPIIAVTIISQTTTGSFYLWLHTYACGRNSHHRDMLYCPKE